MLLYYSSVLLSSTETLPDEKEFVVVTEEGEEQEKGEGRCHCCHKDWRWFSGVYMYVWKCCLGEV